MSVEHESVDELLHKSHYTPEELAELLDMSVDFIREEALQRRLRAIIIDHHVVSILRHDVITWLDDRR